MIHVLFTLLKGWNFFFHSLMSEVYGLRSESQARTVQVDKAPPIFDNFLFVT